MELDRPPKSSKIEVSCQDIMALFQFERILLTNCTSPLSLPRVVVAQVSNQKTIGLVADGK